jgi:hypothetical protein
MRQTQCGLGFSHARTRTHALTAELRRNAGSTWGVNLSPGPAHEVALKRKPSGNAQTQTQPVTHVVTQVPSIDVSNFVTKSELAQAIAGVRADYQLAFKAFKRQIMRWVFGAMALQTIVFVVAMVVMFQMFGR